MLRKSAIQCTTGGSPLVWLPTTNMALLALHSQTYSYPPPQAPVQQACAGTIHSHAL